MADSVLDATSESGWSTLGEGARLAFRPRTLRRTLTIAAIVGVVLSAVNQGSVILGGDATLVTWIRVVTNFVVPFCVSNAGLLSATRVARGDGPGI